MFNISGASMTAAQARHTLETDGVGMPAEQLELALARLSEDQLPVLMKFDHRLHRYVPAVLPTSYRVCEYEVGPSWLCALVRQDYFRRITS